jgi:AbrB family looped-hinge helix DNA binding protein
LSGHSRDAFEVPIAVEKGQTLQFRHSCHDEVHGAGAAMLSPLRELPLHLPRAIVCPVVDRHPSEQQAHVFDTLRAVCRRTSAEKEGCAVIRGRGQVTLPSHVRLQFGLREGDDLLIAVENGRIVLTPATLIPRDQAWFWTDRWQSGEREVDADLAAGRPGRAYSMATRSSWRRLPLA